MELTELEEIINKKDYDVEQVSKKLYGEMAIFKDVVNHFSGKIIESLFTFFGVESDLPFDRVADRIYDGKITIGSVLAKIKELKMGNEDQEPEVEKEEYTKKTDEEIIGDVLKGVKKKKLEPVAIEKTEKVEFVPKVEIKPIKLTTTIKKDAVNIFEVLGKKDAVNIFEVLGDKELAGYAKKTREIIVKLVEKDTGVQFSENYNGFVTGTGKAIINEFGGNKKSVIASIGFFTIKDLVGEKDIPLGSKKAFYEKLDIDASSCRRAEKKLAEHFE